MSVELIRQGGTAILTLRRPEALNALNTAMLTELATALTAADKNDDVRCIVLTGSDKAFAAGADYSNQSRRTAPKAKTGTRATPSSSSASSTGTSAARSSKT